ncbi:MAG: hypothetical protein R6W70_04135 [bacterium]
MKNIFVNCMCLVFTVFAVSSCLSDEDDSRKTCENNNDCPYGTYCDPEIGECVSKNENGGDNEISQDACSGNGHEKEGECVCNTGYTGENCDQCAEGYEGYPDCKPKDSLCSGVDCNGNGTCDEESGECSCHTGYSGENCDRCAEGYTGYPDCEYKMCEPGERSCKGNIIIECKTDGTGYFELEECAEEGTQCYGGECLDECGIAEAEQSYVGCEYWGAFLQQGGGYESGATYALVVANPNDTEVDVKIYGSGNNLIDEGIIESRGLLSFELGEDGIILGAGISDKGFRLVSTRPVTVTQMNPFGNILMYSNDATLLIPIGAMGKEYTVLTWPTWGLRKCDGAFGNCFPDDTNSSPGYISIVAVAEGSTEVNVNYSADTISGEGVSSAKKGSSDSYNLQQHQILTINSADASCPVPACGGMACDGFSGCYGPDLTGTYIEADKKIAVFAGSECTFIPADLYACDHMEHQIFPLQSWGKSYAVSRTKPRNAEEDFYRILASEDSTYVKWSGGISGEIYLNAGEMHYFSTNSDFVVQADKPILVGQFLASQNAGADTGDPAMMLLVPNEQMRDDYIFLVPPNYDYNRITIVAEKDTEIVLNDTTYDSNNFTQIPGTNWYREWIDMETGAHTLKSDKAVGLYVYGFSQYVSYAYTAGLDLVSINPR